MKTTLFIALLATVALTLGGCAGTSFQGNLDEQGHFHATVSGALPDNKSQIANRNSQIP